jgi:tripartite-type tricarboxylate transporter receptor subunit TctC
LPCRRRGAGSGGRCRRHHGAGSRAGPHKGKILTIVVFTAGGGFDLNARLPARHMGRHVAGNADVIVQNMPGAASLKSVLYLNTTPPPSSMVAAERIEIVRAALDEAVKNPEFVADAAKIRMPVAPKTGRQALRTVEEIYATLDDIVRAARKIAGE